MRKAIAALLIAIFVSAGCYDSEDNHVRLLETKCIDGVEYLVGVRSITGHFRPDGSLYACEEK